MVIVAMNAEIGTTMKADANNNCLMIFIGCPLGLSRDRRMRPEHPDVRAFVALAQDSAGRLQAFCLMGRS